MSVIQLIPGQKLEGRPIPLGINPDIGNLVPGKKLPYKVILQRPARSNDAKALKRRAVALVPSFKQVVEDRIKLLLWRVPWLGEIVVNLGGVDRPDGGLGIGVGGEQGALGFGIKLLRLLKKIDAGHARHALVGEEQGDRVASLLELDAGIEGRLSGTRPQDAICRAIFSAQVLDDRLKHAHVVVDGKNDWFPHRIPVYYLAAMAFFGATQAGR
jgi:hypothetical protein